MQSHRHCDPVLFPDGTTIFGSSLPIGGYDRVQLPDFGLYLDPLWQPPWPHVHLNWPDFGIPDDLKALRQALTDLHVRARQGQMVEVGCIGGHGRTGTTLACLAAMTGVTEDPVQWVRIRYCESAIETHEQVELARSFGL